MSEPTVENNTVEKPSGDPVDAARALIQAQMQERVISCNQEIQAALKKYNCAMMPKVSVIGNQIESDILIRALP